MVDGHDKLFTSCQCWVWAPGLTTGLSTSVSEGFSGNHFCSGEDGRGEDGGGVYRTKENECGRQREKKREREERERERERDYAIGNNIAKDYVPSSQSQICNN